MTVLYLFILAVTCLVRHPRHLSLTALIVNMVYSDKSLIKNLYQVRDIMWDSWGQSFR